MQNAIIEFLWAKAKKKEKQRIYCRGDAALQHTATDCNTLQQTAIYCNILQQTATDCNTLQHTGASFPGAMPQFIQRNHAFRNHSIDH
jgi:hypothetical protein